MLSEDYLKARNWTFGFIMFSPNHSFLLKVSGSEEVLQPCYCNTVTHLFFCFGFFCKVTWNYVITLTKSFPDMRPLSIIRAFLWWELINPWLLFLFIIGTEFLLSFFHYERVTIPSEHDNGSLSSILSPMRISSFSFSFIRLLVLLPPRLSFSSIVIFSRAHFSSKSLEACPDRSAQTAHQSSQ